MKCNSKLFAAVLGAEADIAKLKSELDEHTFRLKSAIRKAEARADQAWAEIEANMRETGEYELVLHGRGNDFKIAFSTPRDSVDVVDIDAVPDEYVKVERKPMKKEISDHLRHLLDAGADLPNWAKFAKGEPKLGYRLLKEGAA